MNYRKFFFLVVFIIGIVLVIKYSGISCYLEFQSIKEHANELRAAVHENYTRSVFLFIALYTFALTCFLPTSALLTLTGGFLFGTLHGALYTIIGSTCGSIIAFLLVRHVIGDYVQERFHDRLIPFNTSMHKYGARYLLITHFVAIIPFAIVNILTGLTRVSLWTFIWTTALGVLPGALIYSYAGQELTKIERLRDILELKEVFWMLVALKVIALLPLIINKIREYRNPTP